MLRPETTDKKPNECCIKDDMHLEYSYGDGVEWEVWDCIYCHQSYYVEIEIVRDFKNMERVKENKSKKKIVSIRDINKQIGKEMNEQSKP